MPIMATRGGSYTPAPEGNHDAVFCDVEDLGIVETQYGKKHQIRLVWQIADKMEDGRPFTIGRRYGLSLHEKAALFKDLKSYAKKAPPQNLDLETLIGKPCQILVTHAERDGSTYANPTSAGKKTNMEILTLVIQIVFTTTAVVLALFAMRLMRDWR